MAIGRPRAFDVDQALDRALDVFWRKGYEGATLCDLTAAMGINPPSLYAAFGNKEGLFRKALDRYWEITDGLLGRGPRGADGAGSGRGAVARHRQVPERSLPSQGLPCRARRTCLRRRRRLHPQGARDAPRQQPGADSRPAEAGQEDGDLPADADPAALARYLATVIEGMAVQAAGGASRKELERVAETALRAFPD